MNLNAQKHTEKFSIYNADCVEVLKEMPENCIDYSISSPPFLDLYTYSDNPFDMSNASNVQDFFDQFAFLADELYRTVKPGRLVSMHCMDIPAMKERDGFIGLKDFPSMIRAAFEKSGFIFHSRHILWKDPLLEATRTKALGLMHKQLCKDSAMCRAGIPDQVITMRKPGDNITPISHNEGLTEYFGGDKEFSRFLTTQTPEKRSHYLWRQYASPVWMDIRQTHTLNKGNARDNDDEKHICPLQLDTVSRLITLYSLHGEFVFTPFAGIGTELRQSILMGRKAAGAELKTSYFNEAVKNCMDAASQMKDLFS